MQLSGVSLQAFMTLSAPRTVCCSVSAELVELALSRSSGLVCLVFFSRASLQPLRSVHAAMVNHRSYSASEMERGRGTVCYARWNFLIV